MNINARLVNKGFICGNYYDVVAATVVLEYYICILYMELYIFWNYSKEYTQIKISKYYEMNIKGKNFLNDAQTDKHNLYLRSVISFKL